MFGVHFTFSEWTVEAIADYRALPQNAPKKTCEGFVLRTQTLHILQTFVWLSRKKCLLTWSRKTQLLRLPFNFG